MYGHHEFDLYEAIYTTRAHRRLKPDAVAPERDRLMMIAATVLTSRVITNRAIPAAISAEISLEPASRMWLESSIRFFWCAV